MLAVLRTKFWADYKPLEAAFAGEAQTRRGAAVEAAAAKVMLNVPAPAATVAPVEGRGAAPVITPETDAAGFDAGGETGHADG